MSSLLGMSSFLLAYHETDCHLQCLCGRDAVEGKKSHDDDDDFFPNQP